MRNIYLIGPTGSGKTAVAAALALDLRDHGYRVAYFKPVGFAGEGRHDEDAVLMRGLLGMDVPVNTVVPINASALYLWRYERAGSYLGRIREAFDHVAGRADVVIIGGAPSPYHMASLGLDAVTIAGLLNPLVLTVLKVVNDFSIDLGIFYHKCFQAHHLDAAGVILNNVPRTLLDKARGVYRQVLEDRGFPVLGIVPQQVEIAMPTVYEFAELLEAEVLTGEERLGNIIEDIVVGAMAPDSAMRYFRRAQNKAVITGGDRPDLALAALETGTSALILTGGLYPEVQVIARAEEKQVPVLLTEYDTYTTTELLRTISHKFRCGDERSLQTLRDNFHRHCNYKAILQMIEGQTPVVPK